MNYMKFKMDGKIGDLKASLGRGGAIPELKSAVPMWRDCFNAIQTRMGVTEQCAAHFDHHLLRISQQIARFTH